MTLKSFLLLAMLFTAISPVSALAQTSNQPTNKPQSSFKAEVVVRYLELKKGHGLGILIESYKPDGFTSGELKELLHTVFLSFVWQYKDGTFGKLVLSGDKIGKPLVYYRGNAISKLLEEERKGPGAAERLEAKEPLPPENLQEFGSLEENTAGIVLSPATGSQRATIQKYFELSRRVMEERSSSGKVSSELENELIKEFLGLLGP